MSEAPAMEYNYNVDQLASANAYFDVEINGETVRIQITSRHMASVEKIVAATENLISAYTQLREAHPRQLSAPAPVEPHYEAVEGQPQVLAATAGRLSVEMKDNKYFYKIVDADFHGKRGTKYGLMVWPEVFEAAGLTVKPDALPNITGWRVDYVLNEKGYPSKVTRLLPPKS